MPTQPQNPQTVNPNPDPKPSEPAFNPAIPETGKVSDALLKAFTNAQNPVKTEPVKTEPVKIEPNATPIPASNTATQTEPAKLDPTAINLEEAESKFKKGESAYAFHLIKQQRDQAQRERDDAIKAKSSYEENLKKVQQQVKEYEDKLTLAPKDYEEIKKERDQLSSEIGKLAWEKSPEFRKTYEDPIKSAKDRIKSAVAGTEIKEHDIESVLLMQDPQQKEDKLNEIFLSLSSSPAKMNKLGVALSEYERLMDARSQALTNHGQYLESVKKSNLESAKQRADGENKLFDEVVEQARKVTPFLTHIDGNEAFNKRADEILAYAKNVWNGNVPDQSTLAEITIAGALLPAYQGELISMYKAYEETFKELESTKKELEEIKGATPSINSGNGNIDATKQGNIYETFSKATGLVRQQ